MLRRPWSIAALLVCARVDLASAQSCPNAIICENLLPGDPDWVITASGGIQGYATDISINVGETISFKVRTDAPAYRLDIYRLGYYGGIGARKITTVVPSIALPRLQPPCISDSADLANCADWNASVFWQVPTTAVSGIYIGRLVRSDTSGASYIPFVIREDTSRSEVLFQTSDEAWQVRNSYHSPSPGELTGTFSLTHPASRVNYDHPFHATDAALLEEFFHTEYPTVRWLEANGLDVSYFTSVDAGRRGELILNHKMYLSAGDDEYASQAIRQNMEAAREAGVRLTFLSAALLQGRSRMDGAEPLAIHRETINDVLNHTARPSSTSRSSLVTSKKASGSSAKPQTAPVGATVQVEGNLVCPCSIWSDATLPATAEHSDSVPVEVGMKFRSDVPGFVAGVRFYKGPRNTGAHVGSLWTVDGVRLASVTFTNETPSGWQQANFARSIPIIANTTYIVSYFAPVGSYASDANFFNIGIDRPPLHALVSGSDGPNGVFVYSPTTSFPNQTFRSTNYWVDVVFSTSDPLAAPAFDTSDGTHSVALAWIASTSLGIAGYNVYRAVFSGGPYALLNTSPVTDVSYVDNMVAPGKTYYYVATTVGRDSTESTYSNEAVAAVPSGPPSTGSRRRER
jgi:hypothetical protein